MTKNYLVDVVFFGEVKGYTYQSSTKCKSGDVVIVQGQEHLYSLAQVFVCIPAPEGMDLTKYSTIIEKTSLNLYK